MADGLTIAAMAARCGLPESTLRYWERIGLVGPVWRDPSSGHRRYDEAEALQLETLANLRAVGLSIEDMRIYLAQAGQGDASALQQRDLFQAHADRLDRQLEALELRRRYLDLKVRYWSARAAGDADAAAALALQTSALIATINPGGAPHDHAYRLAVRLRQHRRRGDRGNRSHRA
jgi:DNA-binding transcriptional MerR regulator